ncbi:MAG: FAD-binding oxidoreductase [Pseudomonadota bacterium]
MMDEALKQKFIAIVGEKNALTDAADQAPHLKEWRGRWTGATPLVLKPGSTGDVSALVKLAHETRTAIVPQGGNTGLVGGQIPDASGSQIIVSLSRMNAVRDIDTDANTITVDAGVVLQTIQNTADAQDRLFPLALAAQGSAMIGGNLSTNAGGVGALAYGVARDVCIGLEVVLPNGDVLDDLNTLKKNNTGYDLRNVFIGAEGTLGIITGAVLKLFPKPKARTAAFVGLATPHKALALLRDTQSVAGSALTAFELMPRFGVEITVKHMDGLRDPLEAPHPWYVLLEVSSLEGADHASGLIDQAVENGLETDLIRDGTIAASEAQRIALWALREGMSESQIPEGGSIKHDISVPVGKLPDFMDEAAAFIMDWEPAARICAFGHLGDGNLHYNISQPEGADKQAFLARIPQITPKLHDLVVRYGGSVSAEHGIGQMKRNDLTRYKDPVALATMRAIKKTLDPHNIMNPGKVLPD